ncbi:META domain-containing protein [Kribbella sp. NPDC049227]|uniref:META domain-containing protein n=1 Tax=Kribbella sp. NPDC049227 TaxID=3364113 RepID=UPI003718C51D
MSNTDLEDDLRATLDRAAASVPPVTGLTERATTGARQAQRRTWIASGAAAVAVAAIAVVGFNLAGKDAPSQSPVAAGTTSATPSAKVQSQLSPQSVAGTWRPVEMDGLKTLKAARPEDPVLVLLPDGTWNGSDGCNGLQGTYTIGQRGEFTATVGPQRMVGCENVPHTGVLKTARRVALDADTLRFFAADGRQLASYARAR